MEKQKMNIATLVIVIAIVLIVGVIAGVLIGKNMNQVQTSKKNEVEKMQPIAQNAENTSNTSSLNQVNNQASNKNTYEKLKGVYGYSCKISEEEIGNEGRVNCGFTLILADDGTFEYATTIHSVSGFLGNYIINDSELVLNKIFSFGSDAGITLTKGQVKLKINQDGTIQDTNKYHEYGEPITNFTLKRETDKLSYGVREHIINAIKGNTIGIDENINI